ncbi:MAG TPA: LamG-like jellyroll fold domain-containing protein, partial [Verrucomicrobiae bacterium]|nr:LamG-like jellyroll fold domain-containing protein [Verrucomicrobiae bacterium]
MNLKTLCLAVAGIFALFTAGTAPAQDVHTLYSTPSAPTWRDNYNGGSGCIFTVGPTNVVVSHLGYFCSNAVSLAQVQITAGLLTNHYVGIYSASPVQLLAQVIVPSGTGADYYTNQFVWMPLDPPFLLQSNTTYYVAALTLNGDGDLWGDTFTATFDPFFVGDTTNTIQAPQTAYGPGGTVWPVAGFSLFGSNSTYCVEGMANLPIDQARVGVQSTNIFAASGPLTVVGFASGQQPINYQWWQAGSPPTPVAGQTGPDLTFANATSADSGVYFLTASNSAGGETSPNVVVSVSDIPVAITAGPTNTTVFNNYPATFSMVVTGAPPISIQWYSNNVAVASATNVDVNAFVFTNTFTFTAQSTNNGDIYSVVAANVVNGTPYAVTNSASLTVLPNFGYPQNIMHGPPSTNIFFENNQNGMSGDTGNNPTGSGGGKIIMANTVLITHLGYDAVGLALNNQAQLNANHHISLYDTNGNLLGYVVLTNGTPTSSAIDGYLWAPLNPPILLTNKGTYTIAAEEFYDTDPWGTTYVPTNWDTYITPGGAVDSAVYATGAWPAEPASGGYGSQIYSAPNMGDLVISNEIFSLIAPATVTQAAGTSATLNGYVNGPPPVTVQWYQNGVAMPGQTNINLTLNNLSAGTVSYTLVAMNGSLSATSAVATVTAFASPVIINALPQTYTNIANTNLMALYAGANPTFSISALGAGTLTYRWYTNGVLIPTATGPSYHMTNVQPGGATNFFCVVSNFYNSTAYTTTSAVWSAAILPVPTGSTGGPAPYPQSVLSLNPLGYWRMNDTNLDGVDYPANYGNGDFGWICHDYAGGNDGIYTNCEIGFPGYNPIEDPSDSSAQFGETDDLGSDFGDSLAFGISGINFATPAGSNTAFTIEAWVSADGQQNTDAGIVTLGWGGGGEQFDLDCGSDTAPTSHGFRFLVRGAAGTVYGVTSTVEGSVLGQGPWFHLVGVVDEISNQNVTFYINGTNVGSAAIPPGSGILAGTNVALGHLSLMGIGARTAAQVGSYSDQFDGNINDVAIYNFALSSNQVLSHYLEGGQVAPYLNPAPPANLTAVAGAQLILPAIAFGTPTLGYQWVDETKSTVLASATGPGTSLNASYTNNAVPSNWNGDTLELTVTNAYGVTNEIVALTVTLAPSITTNLPPTVAASQGNLYTYYLGVVGEPPLGYQWYENGIGIPNATNATYMPSTSGGSTNTFYAIVTNSYGSVTSATSTFSVLAAPTNALASAILALNPVGYWPMNELEPYASGDIETNYGTLGALANGYYTDWMQPFSGFQHNYPCPIGGDNNSVFYSITASGGGSVTNAMLVNPASRATVLNPPFTVECWCYFTQNTAYGDVWSQNGYEGINAGNLGGGGGGVCGIRLDWGGNGANELTVYGYDNSSGLNNIIITPQNLSTGVWTHCVVTCDASTNFNIFTNGVLCATGAGVGKYSPDYWTPFAVGSGRGYTRSLPQTAVADVAIYTNIALSAATIMNNYMVGTNPNPAVSYFQTVTSLQPPVFLRMDSPTYSGYPAYNTLPVVYGYGSGALNGVYTPGTAVGVAPGPSANGVAWAGTPAIVPAMSGVSSFGDIPYSAAYNLTNVDQPFSATVTFRCNPSDNRYQCILGRGDSSWRFALSGNNANSTPGGLQFAMGAGNGSPTAYVYPSSKTLNCNDGNWHQAVGVFSPASNPNLPSTVFLYVDGQLATINTLNTTNN